MVRVPSSSELGSPTGPVDIAQHPRLESSKFDQLVTTCPIPSNKATLYIYTAKLMPTVSCYSCSEGLQEFHIQFSLAILATVHLKFFYVMQKISTSEEVIKIHNLAFGTGNIHQNKQGNSKTLTNIMIQIIQTTRCATVSQVYYSTLMCGSTCFERLPAHHQEHTAALGASGFTVEAWWLKRCWSWSADHDQKRSSRFSTTVKPEAPSAAVCS
jgi:hypothetical protein